MIKRKQLFRHQPHNEIFGDCHRTAIACLLDLEPWQVPHFYQKEYCDPAYDADKEIAKFLEARGLFAVEIHFDGASTSVAGIFDYMEKWNPRVFYIMGGCSPRGTNHSVVCKGGEFYWDPAKQGGNLVGPLDNNFFRITFFLPLSMRGAHG